jgi:hypothetical protein
MLERALAVAGLVTLLVGGALLPDARAQTAGETDFATSDLNDDGVVDREEYHRRMMDVMLLADTDKDGALSADELSAADPDAVAAADIDGDGMLSREEFMDARFEDFEAADQDGDGTLSAAEVDAWR